MFNYGAWLKNEIERSGLNIQQVAYRAGYTREYLYALMKNDKNPSFHAIESIAEALGCEIEFRRKDDEQM